MDAHDLSLWDAARRSPTRTAVFVALPLLLATLQLGNALLNGLPLWAAGAFAVAMVCYSAMFLRLHHSRLRVRLLERGTAA